MQCAALLVGAGQGLRHGGEIPKQYQMLDGIPVFRRTLLAFLHHPQVDEVVAVIGADAAPFFAIAADGLDAGAVFGGASRSASVRAGLEALAARPPDLVLVHDAARPFISAALICRLIAAVPEGGGVAPGLPPADALKRLEGDHLAADDVPRADLIQVQTPQVFDYAALRDAYARLPPEADLADDLAVARAAGLSCTLIAGDADNFKITRPGDLERGARLLRGRSTSRTISATGFDVHRLAAGKSMMLCGCRLAEGLALTGHSDADVALHALTDALFGALAAGDLGDHFPPGDSVWKNADSSRFVRHAMTMLAQRGGHVLHIDLTLIGERPKIAPHRATMRARLGQMLGLDVARVSLKATTTEGLGFLGRSEGLAALAHVTVCLPDTGKNTL